MSEAFNKSTKLFQEQVESVFERAPYLLAVDVCAGTLLLVFALLVPDSRTTISFLWYGLLITVSILSYLSLKVMQRSVSHFDNYRTKEKLLLLIVILSGLLWGTTWVIAPGAGYLEAPRGATILFPFAILISAIVNLSTLKKLFFAFAVPLVLGHALFVFYQGSTRDIQLGSILIIFLIFVSFLALRTSAELNKSISLRLKNEMLDEKLSHDQAILMQREIELQTRIEREQAHIVEKRRNETDLENAATEKLLLLDAVSEGIFGINETKEVSFTNSMTLKFLGYEENELLGKNVFSIFCTPSNAASEISAKDIARECLETGIPVQSVNGFFCGKNQREIPVRFSCRPTLDKGFVTGAVVSFLDITQQLELEKRLRQSQKMEAIGRITGGVAHDFNNLLTVIMGNLQFLKRRLIDDNKTEDAKLVDNLVGSAKNGAELNNRLLSFSREQALLSKPENINELLREMTHFMRQALTENTALELDLCDEQSTVYIDRAQFENVLINLCVNAKDAMPDGGQVKIQTQHADTSRVIESNLDRDKNYLQITITDNGAGIPAEIQDKIFDPFFTTKPMGEGSGFGLSTAFGFVHQSGGTIKVNSREGEWTTFTILLPLTDKEAKATPEPESILETQPRFSGTVLVVEDNKEVLSIAQQILMESGYEVLIAEDADEGLAQLALAPHIDLVFSDIKMPGRMDGIDLAKKVIETSPMMPVLLASGFAEQDLKTEMEQKPQVTFIAKPYDTEKLPALISRLINARNAS